MIEPAELMRLAIDSARSGIEAGQTPFGCAIALSDQVIAVAHNTVLSTTDITAHAEINALRQACRKAGNILLQTATVASTCEPCPMCMAALHWARVERVYYGATIGEAARAGFNELTLPAADILRQGNSPIKLVSGLLVEECQVLFDEWTARPGARPY